MPVTSINHTIDIWIEVFQQKKFQQLCAQPAINSWSLGQLGIHLIEATGFYLQQIEICISTNDNANEDMLPAAKQLFQNNELPDVLIEGPPTNAATPQPASKEALLQGLTDLKEKIKTLEILIATSSFKGKTKHPGLHYFTAKEWLQFADMHLRHHLKQLKRIETFLTAAE